MSSDFGEILDEHLKRISDIHQILFIGADPDSEDQRVYDNKHLNEFLSNKEDTLLHYSIDQLGDLKNALRVASEDLAKSIEESDFKASDKVLDAYVEFDRLSNEMILRLHRLEHDHTQEDSGLDPVTGFRTQNILFEDLERELSSCARRNDFLCVALGRIDRYPELKEKLSAEDMQKVIVDIASIFKKTLRLYDDAYRLQDGKFFIVFKHTDKMGAISAIDRFVEFLEKEIYKDFLEDPFIATLDKGLSVSFVITEIEVQEDTKLLLNNLHKDLDDHMHEKSLALEYLEISEVEKYAKNIK